MDLLSVFAPSDLERIDSTELLLAESESVFCLLGKTGETLFELDTWLGKKNKIKAITKEDYYITLDKKDIRHLKVFLECCHVILF